MTTAEIPLSRTKIIVPALRPEVLHRARLLSLFDDLLDRKLIILAAPAGYGKTTLLVDFARQSEMPVCWLSLDSLDKDPQRFCAYLIAALAERFPKFGQQSNAVLRSLTNLEGDTEWLLSTLVNEIDARTDEHFVLMVDDYQFVDTVPEIRNLFSRFIFMAGENCHFVLSSRRVPSLPDITLMVARQQVGGFDLQQLAFRPDEIRSLFETSYGVTLADSTVEELVQQTEGWITGLHLSASSTAGRIPDLTQAARTTGVNLSDFLDRQVLAPQPPKVRNFLLQTSLLDEFDASLCEAVLGKGNWKSLIRTIRQDNLFVLQVGPDGKWVRYHHLFQDFLQKRLCEDEPETAQAILTRLAEVYKERHEWEKAYAVYRQLGDSRLVADLLEVAGMPLLVNARFITLRSWLDGLPLSLIEERSSLLSLKGALLCSLGEGRSALTLLDQAVPEFEKSGDIPGLALVRVRRAAAYRLLGEYEKSLQDADEALRLSDGKPDLQPVYADAERFEGVCLNHLGRVKEAIRFQEDAMRRYEKLGEKQRVARVQMELGSTYRTSGNYTAARNIYEQALAEWRREENMLSEASVLNNLGVLLHNQGKYEEAVQAFEAGIQCARQSRSSWNESLLLASLGDLYTDLDEYEAAKEAYLAAAEALKRVSHQFLVNYLNLAQARLARLCGQVKKAHYYLNRAGDLVRSAGSNHESGLFYLESGCLHLAEESLAPAIMDLEQACDYFQDGGLAAESAWSRVWLAAAQLASGEIAAVRSSLQAALEAEQTQIGFAPLLPAVRQAQPWLAPFRSDPEIGPFLSPWLERAAQFEAQLPALRKRLRHLPFTIPIQAPHLIAQAFGKARVRANGKLITQAQWKTASVRELFFYLLATTQPLTKEEIGEALWPGMDPLQLKLHFKNDLYRLRHALGAKVVLFENDHYSFYRQLDYEYDVEDFTTHLAKAQTATQVKEKITNLRAATKLWNGPYLQDLDANWAWPERERLKETCLEAFKQLATALHQEGQVQAALQACRGALHIEPCREDFYRLAMRLHAEQGDRLAVIWQYQACSKALREELDVAPSEETEALYGRLTA
jgi:LuxR family maltose regulon positive regulatory protein